MNAFCTIITRSHLPYARVLYQSIKQFLPSIHFRFVVVDDQVDDLIKDFSENEFSPVPLDALLSSGTAKNIFEKYAHTNMDHFRWSLKPILILHLLKTYKKVIFVDPDVYFVEDPVFLLDQLDDHCILLSPQWSEVDPLKYEDGLFTVLRNGLYTGAFVGATPPAEKTLHWWAQVCHYKMAVQKELGVFVDQKYLDLFPLLNERTALIRHPGCNLTNINLLTCVRSLENGKLKINKEYDPVFIHFTGDTQYNIIQGNDPLLRPVLNKYLNELKQAGLENISSVNHNWVFNIKQKIRIRTRIKRLLFRLSEKV